MFMRSHDALRMRKIQLEDGSGCHDMVSDDMSSPTKQPTFAVNEIVKRYFPI